MSTIYIILANQYKYIINSLYKYRFHVIEFYSNYKYILYYLKLIIILFNYKKL